MKEWGGGDQYTDMYVFLYSCLFICIWICIYLCIYCMNIHIFIFLGGETRRDTLKSSEMEILEFCNSKKEHILESEFFKFHFPCNGNDVTSNPYLS